MGENTNNADNEKLDKIYNLLELIYMELLSFKAEIKSDVEKFVQETNTRSDKSEDMVNKHDLEIKVIKAAK